jgi:hypothetical protein
VFAAGFSWGCDYVTALACCRGTKLRAIAAASCTDEFSDTTNYQSYTNGSCPALGPTGVRYTFDPNGDSAYTKSMFTSTNALFRSWNTCSTSSTQSGSCASFQGCRQPFLSCGYAGLGHALPPGWNTDTWNFFSSFH